MIELFSQDAVGAVFVDHKHQAIADLDPIEKFFFYPDDRSAGIPPVVFYLQTDTSIHHGSADGSIGMDE
jgi:hypothetical protein